MKPKFEVHIKWAFKYPHYQTRTFEMETLHQCESLQVYYIHEFSRLFREQQIEDYMVEVVASPRFPSPF